MKYVSIGGLKINRGVGRAQNEQKWRVISHPPTPISGLYGRKGIQIVADDVSWKNSTGRGRNVEYKGRVERGVLPPAAEALPLKSRRPNRC